MSSENGKLESEVACVSVVVNRLRERRAEIARAMFDHILAAVPDSVGARDPTYQAGLLDAVGAVLDHSFRAIENGPDWNASVPSEAVAQARRAARVGVSLGSVLRRYVAGHRRLSEFVAEEIERVGLPANAAELQGMHRTQEKLLEQLTTVVEREHDQESQRLIRSPEQRRLESIRRLLADSIPAQHDLSAIRYRFDAWHIGVIVSGDRTKETLESLSDGRQLLSIVHPEGTAWGWLGCQRKPTYEDVERIRSYDQQRLTVLALGEPAQGLAGWRLTHQQAQIALRIALLGKEEHTRYADVALLDPWIQHPDQAQALIDLYLSPLVGEKDRDAVLRQTLRAYLEANGNVSSAARHLAIDRRTLSYRLGAIEECLGYKLNRRKAELEIALRLHELLEHQEMLTSA